MQLRFVGASADVIGARPLKLRQFGQAVDISDSDLAHVVGEGGAHFIPEDEFAALGFSDSELRQVSTADGLTRATAEIKAKVQAAQEAAVKFSEGV